MPKRSRYKRETEESKALKALRINSGLSQRELAKEMNVPQTRVAHSENGRAYIRKPYIELFLKALNLKWEDWEKLVVNKSENLELREECKELLERISDDKLRLIHGLLITM